MTLSENGQTDTPKLDFPCRYDIKAMGKHTPQFEALVRSIVARHVTTQHLHTVTCRPSKENTYVSITVTITALGYDQLNAIYQDLSGSQDVLFAL